MAFGATTKRMEKMIRDHTGPLVNFLLYKARKKVLTIPKEQEKFEDIYEEGRQRSQSSTPAATIKRVNNIEDDDSVQNLPDMLFEHDQETITVGEVVRNEIEPRYRPCSYHSDGMWNGDGSLQKQENTHFEDAATTTI